MTGIAGTGNPPGRPSGVEGGKATDKDMGVIEELRRKFSQAQTAEQTNRDNYVLDTSFSSSNDMWSDDVKKLRGEDRPTLTFNRLNGIIRNVVGDYRQNKLAIKVMASGGMSTVEKADVLAGIIRNIEIESVAEVAYVNGLECSARGNIGWMRLVAEYEDPDSFNQKLSIKPVHNPLTVYCDPYAKERTRKDANWMIVTEMVPKDEFKKEYPGKQFTGFTEGDGAGKDGGTILDWVTDDAIRVAEYYTKEEHKARLVAFDNGAVVQIDDDKELEVLAQIGWNPTKERQSSRTYVRWQKCSGVEVLEERLYKTQYIPLVPILGEEVNVEGKSLLRSLIYYAKDAQKMLNYWKTAATEAAALSSKAPWLLTPEQVEDLRGMWDNANAKPRPYLLYNFVEGQPQPTRNNPPSPPVAELQLGGDAGVELQYTTCVFDAALGQKSNAISGVAESERQSQSATSTFLFVDNLRAAIEHMGRVIIDWIPIVYDTERVIRVIGLEGESENIFVNQKNSNPLMGIVEVLNDIRVGKYDVIVEAGQAFASRRREAVDGMIKLMTALPQLGMLIADLAVKNMDWPGAEECAERIKRALPPQVTTDPDSPEGQAAAAAAAKQGQDKQQMEQTVVGMKMQETKAKTDASLAKSHSMIVKAEAEVVKAHTDMVAALHQDNTHQVPREWHDLKPPASQELNGSGMQITLAKSPEDKMRDHVTDRNHASLMDSMSTFARHLADSHQMNSKQTDKLHELLGHLINSHGELLGAINRQNEIALMPEKAVRDPKTGKVVGKHKVPFQAQA
jgi:hypothetical protein